jgi:hypothetical protein
LCESAHNKRISSQVQRIVTLAEPDLMMTTLLNPSCTRMFSTRMAEAEC